MMKKHILFFTILFLLVFISTVDAQVDSVAAFKEIKKFQKELNEEYSDLAKSPLEKGDVKHFKSHVFFPVELKYRVVAKLKRTDNELFFQMETTIPRLDLERIFGILTFSLEGKEFSLPVYQSQSLMQKEEYKDYLFLPFTDFTNGNETYDGGRYIDLRIPAGNEIVIDFNKAYNPYCAYSHRFSCPIVPSRNHLEAAIFAGVRYTKK